MLHHAHIKHHTQYSVNRTNTTNHQQMAMVGSSEAPRVMAEPLLHIAYQNKFTPFKGLGFPSLHHKPHYNTHLFLPSQTSLQHIYSAERTQLLS